MSVPQSTPTLYQPTADEINSVTTSAKRRHPECTSRIDKAADILTAGLQLDQVAWEVRNVVRWRIASQSNNGLYVVCGLTCPCQDKRVKFCKHAISVALYSKILTNRLNTDIRNRAVDLAILEDGTFHVYGYAPKMGIVHVAKSGSAYTFVDAASAVRYSTWAAQQLVVVEWPVEEWPSAAANCVFA